MAGTNDQTLKELINELLKEYKLSDKLKEKRIIEWWPKIVGKMIANHTTGIYFKDKKLYITVDNAALREELQYARSKLLKSLNRKLGEAYVEELIFK